MFQSNDSSDRGSVSSCAVGNGDVATGTSVAGSTAEPAEGFEALGDRQVFAVEVQIAQAVRVGEH